MRIRFASAPCGSGKTYNLIDWACALAHAGQRVIVLQPTHELIDKTVEEELDARTTLPLYRVFHGGTVREGTVAKALIRFLKDPPDGGHIVFNTHALLPVVPFWPNKAGYELMVGEELPAFRYRAHRIPHNHSFITGSIDIEPVNAMYGRVNVVDEELAEIGRNKDGDDLFEVIAETVRIITNPHWDTFVNLEQYEKLRSGKIKRLAFHSILGPSVVEGFGSVFMTSANFRDTPICRLWSEKGVEFQEAKQFSEALRFTQHPNGNPLTIHYASDHAWSRKRLQATAGPDGRIAFDLMVEAAKRLFEGSSFVWQANKSQAANPFGENAFRLPNKPHGLNSFLHVNDIPFLSALNPTTDHFRFLETQGLTGSEVRRAVYHSAAYQSVMRTSLRDPESSGP